METNLDDLPDSWVLQNPNKPYLSFLLFLGIFFYIARIFIIQSLLIIY
jgi:hypothetical protein